MKHISEEQRIMCDKAIMFKELPIAMDTLAIGNIPGIDGFPVNFYNHFWDTLGHFFLQCCVIFITEGWISHMMQTRNFDIITKKWQ